LYLSSFVHIFCQHMFHILNELYANIKIHDIKLSMNDICMSIIFVLRKIYVLGIIWIALGYLPNAYESTLLGRRPLLYAFCHDKGFKQSQTPSCFKEHSFNIFKKGFREGNLRISLEKKKRHTRHVKVVKLHNHTFFIMKSYYVIVGAKV
jgi:hypothetical protein